jgi:Protein of unknown function (DUF4012)
MKKRILIGVFLAVLVVVLVSTYLAIATAGDLLAARNALRGSVEDLEAGEIEEARSALSSAADRLDGVMASTVGVIPVVGHNLRALETVADGAGPVLDSALELRRTADELDQENLVQNGRVRLDLLERLAGPLESQAEALGDLTKGLEEARSGWLLPPVVEETTELVERTASLEQTASRASTAATLAPAMLGGEEPRTYLALLVNNAELRGAGGILSAVGTVTMSDGGIRLGDFSPYGQLGSKPYEKVAAPPDYLRRYSFALANSTLWINTTYSPQVPDDALVASRLYEKVKNISTDGAIVVDPRGIAALMPPDATVESPSGGELDAESLPRYIYSTAYQELGGGSEERRSSLLEVGRDVFKLLAQRGPGGVDELDGLAKAISGGHLRFVSFDEQEAQLLNRTGASGALPGDAIDSVHVNVQNHGPDKLDFWARRSVEHRCSITDDEALCETRATIRNEAPDGLSEYVSPRPNNEMHEFLEIYLPSNADVTSAALDGEPAQILRDTEAGRVAIGTDIQVQSGNETTFSVTYGLPLENYYDSVLTPQPLTHDAEIVVDLDVPDGWSVTGPNGRQLGDLHHEGWLVSTLRFEAAPENSSGISRIWDALSDFWNEELL